jgi:hypothetical protein
LMSVKYQILSKPWTLLPSYTFPTLTSRNRRFQLKRMDRFPFLSYTERQGGGALCQYCIFFAQVEVGKGRLVKLGKLFTKPFSKWKNSIEWTCRARISLGGKHVSSEFHIGLPKQEERYFRKPRFR